MVQPSVGGSIHYKGVCREHSSLLQPPFFSSKQREGVLVVPKLYPLIVSLFEKGGEEGRVKKISRSSRAATCRAFGLALRG